MSAAADAWPVEIRLRVTVAGWVVPVPTSGAFPTSRDVTHQNPTLRAAGLLRIVEQIHADRLRQHARIAIVSPVLGARWILDLAAGALAGFKLQPHELTRADWSRLWVAPYSFGQARRLRSLPGPPAWGTPVGLQPGSATRVQVSPARPSPGWLDAGETVLKGSD